MGSSVELREVAANVYACLQENWGLGFSNSGFLHCGEGLVVDTFWDLPHTRRLRELYARVWSRSPRWLVNTHHNGDHCWGNQVFDGAEIIAHRFCAERMSKDTSPEVLEALRTAGSASDPTLAAFARALEPRDFSGIALKLPTLLVDERLDLELDGLRVEIVFVGPAHTAGDLVVHVPERRVVFAGDIVFRLCTPIGWEGTFERWEAALDWIDSLEPAVVVPGHGPLCGIEGVREMKEYLRYVRQESRRCFESGLTVVEAAMRIDPGPYAAWTEPERMVFQVERAYREFRGLPWDSPIDTAGLLRAMDGVRRGPLQRSP